MPHLTRSTHLREEMKPIFALFVVLSLLLVANINLSHARKDLGDYWKKMMNDQPMPEAIKDLIQDQQVQDATADHFIRYFDMKPNIILYHTHVVSKKQQQQKRLLTTSLNQSQGTERHG
ncbi:uncharacterized protein LOC114403187 [Glycine soja]|uniref:Organ-specific protein P4 n=2 Tax=Glycine soja TaxID=3848 RepID=A0A445LW46_GLYSO|nr:uncharacterized protein LOC114403187 [Glycine soja]RZC27443.1 hypothetical protein D0Y65_005514 [Glycine soja]